MGHPVRCMIIEYPTRFPLNVSPQCVPEIYLHAQTAKSLVRESFFTSLKAQLFRISSVI